MSISRSAYFILVGLICIILAVSGILMNFPTTWGLLEIALYLTVITLGMTGILRLIYLKGLPDE